MSWFRSTRRVAPKFMSTKHRAGAEVHPSIEILETRTLPDATASLGGSLLTIVGGPGNDRISLVQDATRDELVLLDGGKEVARYASAAVSQVAIDAAGGNNVVRINNDILQSATIQGGAGNNIFYGGGGPTTLVGGSGFNKLIAGSGATTLIGGNGTNRLFGGAGIDTFAPSTVPSLLYNVTDADTASPGVNDTVVRDQGPAANLQLLNTADVATLLQRAAAASASNDAIIAIVDRGGRLLGLRVESGVSPNLLNDNGLFSFAADGAIALARTAAFFANNGAPLTSRTVQFISQSTITQREVESIPGITDPNSTLRGPGYVAPVGPGGHFPPNINFTPQVDLFEIEHTNRDGLVNPGADHILGTPDDVALSSRFNIPTDLLTKGATLTAPQSYATLRFGLTNASSRGVATLPGGIPIYKNGVLVGGIGVFFPGKTGFATEENSSLSTTYDPSKPDRSLEAEYIAFSAVGGSSGAGASIGTIGGVPPLPGFDLPFGRIDLVGITLDLFGPGGRNGVPTLLAFGRNLGTGNPNDGTNAPIDAAGNILSGGLPVADGNLVVPHEGTEALHLTTADVNQIIAQAISQASLTRAAIRLPLGSRAKFVIAVSDTQGNLLGLFRQQDATIFSIDVAVAKARNVAYYANPAQLQAVDQVPGVPAGAAFTNRTFRYLGQPRFPEGINGQAPGPFSQLNDGGANNTTAQQIGPRLPASAYQSVVGFDSFNPGTNFRDPFNLANQNGIVFFPGALPLYKKDDKGNNILVGGVGISGDGVDQDDVATAAAARGFAPPLNLQSDQYFYNGVRLPFQKSNRNPEA